MSEKNMDERTVSVLGCGPWGQNIIRTVSTLTSSYPISLDGVVHTGDVERAKAVREIVDVDLTTSPDRAMDQSDLVLVATPDDTHADFVADALRRGCHVFVEKPIAYTRSRAEELFQLAEERNRVLCVGHLMVHHPAINFLKQSVPFGDDSVGVFSHRFNNLRRDGGRRLLHGSFIHDLSVFDHWFGEETDRIEIHDTEGNSPDLRYASGVLYWGNRGTVRFQCGREWPARRRSIAIRDSDTFYDFDGLEETVTVFEEPDRRHAEGETRTSDRLPLTAELENFFDAVFEDQSLVADEAHVLRVMGTLDRMSDELGD
jgi:predicted dehydrogenase